MKFCIEDSNLHSFRQGIRISDGWKLILMKNIEFRSNLDISRKPDLANVLKWNEYKWLVETEILSRLRKQYFTPDQGNRAAKCL